MLLFKVNDYDGRWAVGQEWTTFTSLLLLSLYDNTESRSTYKNVQYFTCKLTTRVTHKKIRSKAVGRGSRDLLWKFCDPSISRERLELETSNLSCKN